MLKILGVSFLSWTSEYQFSFFFVKLVHETDGRTPNSMILEFLYFFTQRHHIFWNSSFYIMLELIKK